MMDGISRKTRIEYIDIAKAIGILCIIAGHMGISKIDRVVFTFHVPLFFLISGYFLNRTENTFLFIKKTARALLVPYYFTGMCLILVKIPIDIIKGVSDQIPKDLFRVLIQVLYASGTDMNKTIGGITQIGAIWFLFALFWAKIITKIAIDKKYGGGVFLFLVALLLYYSSLYIWLPFNIQSGAMASLFVYLGAIFKEWKILDRLDWKICMIGFIVLLSEVHFDIGLYVVANKYDYGIVSMIGAVLISGFVVEISKSIGKIQVLKKPLLFYGQNTLIILCYHLIELNNVPWHRLYNKMQMLKIQPWMQSMCIFCVKLIFVTLCTYITLHIKCLRKVFGKS